MGYNHSVYVTIRIQQKNHNYTMYAESLFRLGSVSEGNE